MKNILIISDTHGDILGMEDILKRHDDIDLIIHAGDTYKDAKDISKLYNIPFEAVKGNTDLSFEGEYEIGFEVEGYKFLLVHGHKYGVKSSINSLYYRGLELGVDFIVYGHSHIPYFQRTEEICIINPGSLSRPRNGNPRTYGLLKIDDGKYEYMDGSI